MNSVATSIVVIVAVEVGAHRIMGTANEWCCNINSSCSGSGGRGPPYHGYSK